MIAFSLKSHCVGPYFSVRSLTSVKFISETSSILPNLIELGQHGSNVMILCLVF